MRNARKTIATVNTKSQLFKEAVALVGTRGHQPGADGLWDPELFLNFRPAALFVGADPVVAACTRLIAVHRDNTRAEQGITNISPQTIRLKLQRIRNNLAKAGSELENMRQEELRLVAAAADIDSEFLREIIPDQWPGDSGQSALSRLMHQKAERFNKLLDAVRARREGTAWSVSNKGGKGRNLLYQLGIASSSWQLIHMAWNIFDTFGCAPKDKEELEDLGHFLSYIHQLATKIPDEFFDGDIKKYSSLRWELTALATMLQTGSRGLRCENLYQLDDLLDRRKSSGHLSDRLNSLDMHRRRYAAIRSQLLNGPVPSVRPKKINQKGQP